ncbi:MAG: 5-formyltetrahydrofolate cyclo-ligase [Bacilli bacterium]|nr:5-formyltetrahydrofolate cyclo-ligase [Bacilli bacterium]
MTSTKKDIRKTCLERVSKIADRSNRSFIMKNEMVELLSSYQNIALFASLETEIDTFPLIEELLKEGKNIYLPKTRGKEMDFYLIHSLDELVESKDKYKVKEPSKGNPVDPAIFDIIICPGVAFDRSNNRMGHGQGYYDKYLSRCSVYKIGLCYKEQLLDEIPTDEHDIKMDRVYAY